MVNVAVVNVVPVTMATFPPIVTFAPARFAPVMVTDWPPPMGPVFGLMFTVVGKGPVIRTMRCKLGMPFVMIVAR